MFSLIIGIKDILQVNGQNLEEFGFIRKGINLLKTRNCNGRNYSER